MTAAHADPIAAFADRLAAMGAEPRPRGDPVELAADAAGSRMLVDDGVTGRLCPPRDSAAFLEATAELVGDAALRARMGEAARGAAAQYAWPAVLDRIVGYYDEVASQRARYAGR